MRESIPQQLPLLRNWIDHPHAFELATMSAIIDELDGVSALVQSDLTAGVKNPKQGRPGLSADQVLRILVLKQLRSFSYEVLSFHLADSSTSQAFCRLGIGDGVPAKSTLQENIKKIKPATLEAINKALLGFANEAGIENGRKVRVDSTAIESNIHSPTDNSLLYDVVRVLTNIMDVVASSRNLPFSNVFKRARLRYLELLRATEPARTKLYRELLKATRKTLREAVRIANLLIGGNEDDCEIAAKLQRYSELGKKVVDQTTRRVFKKEKVPASEKIVSIFEPHTDIIVKDRRETVFGHKVNFTSGASSLILDMVVEEGNPADSTRAVPMIERQKEIYGRVPRQVSFDGGYASIKNLEEIKKLGVKDVVFNRKRGLKIADMAKSSWVYKQLTRFRAGIEAGISFLKRCFGLDRVTWRGGESFKSYVWGSVVSANLLILARHLLKRS